jgi:hypothetical protein
MAIKLFSLLTFRPHPPLKCGVLVVYFTFKCGRTPYAVGSIIPCLSSQGGCIARRWTRSQVELFLRWVAFVTIRSPRKSSRELHDSLGFKLGNPRQKTQTCTDQCAKHLEKVSLSISPGAADVDHDKPHGGAGGKVLH